MKAVNRNKIAAIWVPTVWKSWMEMERTQGGGHEAKAVVLEAQPSRSVLFWVHELSAPDTCANLAWPRSVIAFTDQFT